MSRPAVWGIRVACFAGAFAAVCVGLLRAVDAAGVPRPEVPLDVIAAFEGRLARLAAGAGGREERIAFLGDSTAVADPPTRAVPHQLALAANRRTGGEPRVHVFSLAHPGLGPSDFYFLADEVARARPDAVVLTFNPASLARVWARRLNRPQLAGWIRPGRLPEAVSMPLDWIDVTADELLLYAGLVRAGLADAWRWISAEQARVGSARAALEQALDARGGDGRAGAHARFTRARIEVLRARAAEPGGARTGLLGRYGVALRGLSADHPILDVLGATVRLFAERNIRVLVYFVPVNVEDLREAGVYDRRGLERTASAVANAVRSNGGEFADLHDLLPDAAFRDPQGHYAHTGSVDGPRLVAEALAPLVVP